MTGNPAPERPALKKDHIVEVLRRQIASGQLLPGARLPTRLELRDRFHVSVVTVQDALQRLTEEGFVYARGKGGTLVAPRPPHLAHYGFVSHARPGDDSWSLFPMGLVQAAANLERERDCRFRFYHGVQSRSQNAEYQRLCGDVRAERLAGLVVLHSPEDTLLGSPLVEHPPLPVVAISEPTGYPQVAHVVAAWRAFMARALEHLAENGRRRVALVCNEQMREEALAVFVRLAAARGVITRPYWLLPAGHHNPACARNAVHLLFHDRADRPDGLVLADDNIVDASLAGVLAARVRVPRDLEIVAYCNFPWSPATILPVKRMGYHAHQILGCCLDIIDRRRKNVKTPRVTALEVLGNGEPAGMVAAPPSWGGAGSKA
jgi:hypothetical protein